MPFSIVAFLRNLKHIKKINKIYNSVKFYFRKNKVYLEPPYLLDFINFEDGRHSTLGLKRNRKFKKNLQEKTQEDLIDLDAVHNCASPPSPIKSEENLTQTKINSNLHYFDNLYNNLIYRIIQKYERKEII